MLPQVTRESRILQRAAPLEILDPISEHRHGLIAHRQHGKPAAVAEVLRFVETKGLEMADQRKITAHAGLEEERPEHRLPGTYAHLAVQLHVVPLRAEVEL